jgi:hypothetical protein
VGHERLIGPKLRQGSDDAGTSSITRNTTPSSAPGRNRTSDTRFRNLMRVWGVGARTLVPFFGTPEAPETGGVVTAPTAVLIRPDGYVAWV